MVANLSVFVVVNLIIGGYVDSGNINFHEYYYDVILLKIF